MRRLAVAFAALAALASAAGAADLPKQFQGMWVAAEVPKPNKDKCRKEEPKGEDDRPLDAMMGVDGGAVTYYEQYCTVQSAKVLHPPNPNDTARINLDLTLACKGEGMQWSAREIWHYETIDGTRTLAVTALSQTNYRNVEGGREKLPSRIWTSIYQACP